MNQRHFSPLDQLIMHVDQGLRTVFGAPQTTGRANPANAVTQSAELSAAEKKLSGALMRVNHAGEVAAQGLYQGQALTAKLPNVREKMEHAAQEENDHLAWCAQRCKELGTHTSVLDPVWYAGSMAIGAAAGIAGDKWSLGFVAETEHQVVQHLNGHLGRLPKNDAKSRAVLEQMRIDEGQHATTAMLAGAVDLPYPVKRLMRLTSKVMTETGFRI